MAGVGRLVPLALLLAVAHQASQYPEWFIRTRDVLGVRVAVGYAPRYGDLATSVAEAVRNAGQTLRTSSVWLRAEYLQEMLPNGQVAFRGERYEEQPLSPDVDSIVAIDTVTLERMVIVLATPVRGVTRAKTRSPMSASAPSWVAKTPVARAGVYAVGSAEAHFNEHEAWMEAERQARRSLAFSFVTNLRSVFSSQTGGTSNGALVANTAVVIRGIEIRERWRDQSRLFVLVHADHVEQAVR